MKKIKNVFSISKFCFFDRSISKLEHGEQIFEGIVVGTL